MIITKRDIAQFSYMALIAISIFSPDRFGTTLKYVFFPLVLMLIFYELNVRFTMQKLLSIVFLAIIIISTMITDCPGVDKTSAIQRSLCLIVIIYAIASGIRISKQEFEKIKTSYIFCVAICGIIIIIRAIQNPIIRNAFVFIWGLKDINYILAFMLPGGYIALRRILFEEQRKNILSIIAVVTTVSSVLLFQTRSAFVTLLLEMAFVFIEYLIEQRMSWKKIIVISLIIVIAVFGSYWLITSPSFNRITQTSSYEDNVRLIIWNEALKAFKAHPLIGSGTEAASYYSTIAIGYQSHNCYVDIIGDYGLIGLTVIVLLLITICKVEKSYIMHMITFAVVSMLPLFFINGLQTIAFWLPLIILTHESNIIKMSLSDSN